MTPPDAVVGNAYAPPAEVAERDLPPARPILLVFAFALAGVVFGCLCLSALILRVASLEPGGLLPPALYNLVLTVHGSFAFPFLNALELVFLAIACPTKASEKWQQGLFFAALCVVGLQEVAGVTLLVLQLPAWMALATIWVPACVLAACLVMAVPSVAHRGRGSVVVILAAVGAVALPTAQADLAFLLGALAWLSNYSRAREGTIQRRPDVTKWSAIPLTMGALLAFRTLSNAWFALLSFLWFCVSVWLGVIVWRTLSDNGSSTVRWAARAGLALLGLRLLMRFFLNVLSVDVHLHDTLVAVSASHADVFGLGLLATALMLHEVPSFGGPPRRAIQLGLLTSLLGIFGFVGSFFTLGTRGMPRRYMSYLPEFTPLQVAATVSAMIIVVGVLVTAIGLIGSALGFGGARGRQSGAGDSGASGTPA